MDHGPSFEAVQSRSLRGYPLLHAVRTGLVHSALSDYDSEFSTLQLQSGWLDGKRSAEGRTKQMKNVSPKGGFQGC